MVVTVLLPFAPVIPTIGTFTTAANKSISLINFAPEFNALAIIGSESSTPGLTHKCVAPLKVSNVKGLFRLSTIEKGNASDSKNFATDVPVMPSPTMTILELGVKSNFSFKIFFMIYLSFNVAKPISTKITVIIQKRTITRGSGQPFSSK